MFLSLGVLRRYLLFKILTIHLEEVDRNVKIEIISIGGCYFLLFPSNMKDVLSISFEYGNEDGQYSHFILSVCKMDKNRFEKRTLRMTFIGKFWDKEKGQDNNILNK